LRGFLILGLAERRKLVNKSQNRVEVFATMKRKTHLCQWKQLPTHIVLRLNTKGTTDMMTDHPEPRKDYADNGILFSRVVKAGKRVYYIDVKRDRRDEFYISMTESKRVKEGSAEEPPAFEKHKIFLYREDLLKFLSALNDAADFVAEQRPLTPFEHTQAEASVNMGDYSARFALTPEISEENKPLQTEFDLEF
jgi:hypothetical protein